MEEEVKEQPPIMLDLGVGNKKEPNWIGIDKFRTPVTDIVMDLDDPKIKLPFEDDSVSEIRAYHFFEHISNLFPLINECYRVLKPKGHMDIITPLGHVASWGDPSHVRAFTEESWHYFTATPPGNYSNPEIQGRWKILKNDWTPFMEEDTEKLVVHKRRELHAFLSPIKTGSEDKIL